MLKAILLPCLLALATPALAQSQAEVLDAALLPGWRMENGHRMAALSLTLAPHWKTYWRAPGDAGIPPELDWTGSQNLKSVTLHWPSPTVITLNGMESIGYLDRLTLPVEVTAADPAKPVSLRLHMRLGVCKDICMPAELTLAAELSGAGQPDAAITGALAKAPHSPAKAGLTAISCNLTPIADGLHLAARLSLPPQGRPETVVFELRDKTIWVESAAARRDGPSLAAAADLVAPKGQPFALDRGDITVTVIGQSHSVEIPGCPAP
jgi:DsbC/DsbD-like thiol-disulfide interchange protein